MGNNIDDDLDVDISDTKKLDDYSSSVNTDIPSDPCSDDQDMNCLSSLNDVYESSECNNELSFIYSYDVSESGQEEDEVDLYNDLLMLDEGEKNSKIRPYAELEKLKMEIEKLKEANAELTKQHAAKDILLSELTKRIAKREADMISLFETFKLETVRKDILLAEANKEIDNLFHKNVLKYRNHRADESKNSCNNGEPSDKGLCNIKQSTDSPKSSFKKRRNESSILKDKNSNLEASRDKRCASDENDSTSKEHPTQSSKIYSNSRSGFQTLESDNFCGSSRDCTEANNLFFKLIPPPLQKAFHDYEQSQIVLLNKLKQSLINEYFYDDTGDGSNSKTCKSKELPQRHSNSVKSSVFLSPCSDNSNDSPTSKRMDCNSFQNSGKITRSMQQDIVSLFRKGTKKRYLS